MNANEAKTLRRLRLAMLDQHGDAFTQHRVADRIGVDQATLSRWETGDRRPTRLGARAWPETLDRVIREQQRRKSA